MKKFEKELYEIFNSCKGNFLKGESIERSSEYLRSLVSKYFNDAAKFLNNKFGLNLIEIHCINENLLSLLFNIEKGEGLLITFDKTKLVLVLFEDDNFLTFIGRSEKLQGKNIKLLRLSFESEGNDNYTFSDNSGLNVDINEAVIQIIKWGLN